MIPQTPSLVLATYRPEYGGALARVHGAQTIALAPLSDSETAALVSELLGADPSVGAVGQKIAERAAGNPFFVEEMVRELAERDVLRGNRRAYVSTVGAAEVSVPATVQATIAARIDRLDPAVKRTLSAAAVIGSRFDPGLLETLGIEPVLEDLVGGELIDQITFTGQPEYVFHHPLIRTVAYEAQLKSDRAELHRRLAAAIEARSPATADENAALIAEHLEATGDGHAAYKWHMRAAAWATNRDIGAARLSWERAQKIADALPAEDPHRAAMRIAPRTMLCGTAWRAGGTVADPGFDELRDLCTAADDKVSLAIGMTGFIMALTFHNRFREAAQMASEHSDLLESIGDPTLTVALLFAAIYAKCEAGEMIEALRLADRLIDLADGDPTKGNLILGSPLSTAIAMRGHVKMCLGMREWQDDAATSIAMAAPLDSTSYVFALLWKYVASIPFGALPPDATAMSETAEALQIAERSSDDFILGMGRLSRGLALVSRDGPQREAGLDLFTQARDAAVMEQFSLSALTIVDPEFAMEKARTGDLDGAIEMVRAVVDGAYESGDMIWRGRATNVLVELLVRRGSAGDQREAQAAIDRLAAVPTDPGFVLHELPLLRSRALLARAHGDTEANAHLRDRYREMAKTLGYEGHIAWSEAMP